MERPDKDTYYLDIAVAVSKRSTCIRRHYGCVIVKDDVIVATGYNGSPRGCDNCCDIGKCYRWDSERYNGYENCPAVHAEQNALLSVDRAHSQGAIMYLACQENIGRIWFEDKDPKPCNICQRMIQNAGIDKVINRSGLVWG
jgi:dCMP deaminase